MRTIYSDVLCIGAGLAGERVALAAAMEGFHTICLSVVPPRRSHSSAAQGGMQAALGNAVMGKGDSTDIHFADTVKGSDWGCDQEVARIFADSAPIVMREMAHWGVPWNRVVAGKHTYYKGGKPFEAEEEESKHGLIHARAFGGTAKWRTCYTADGTGRSVLNTLDSKCLQYGVEIHDRMQAEALIHDGERCMGAIVRSLRDGELVAYIAKATLIATGGISYPATGSDGSGYKLARQAGHTIVTPQPSLCSLISPDPACRRMMGLALRNVTLTLLCDGKALFTEQGEALFTHFGLSGPLVLSASTYIEDITKHRYICEVDLKPALDEKTLYDRLTRDFAEQGSHSAQGALAKLLPNSMRPVAVEKWGIDPATKAAQITREQKQALVDLCKHWQVPVSALGDKEHAVITAGGVDVREVDPKTMASKLCAGLYFAGEVLDVDARTGGYNLQIAWSTAVAAAKAL